jgi:hypothetical protein
MSLVSGHGELHLPRRTKKPKFAFAEIMAGVVIAMVIIGLGAVAALGSPINLP